MTELSKHVAIPLHGGRGGSFLIQNITVFGPFVYLMEVAIGISLMLGLFSRLGAAVRCYIVINTWLGRAIRPVIQASRRHASNARHQTPR